MTLVKWTPKPLRLINEMDNMVNSVFGNDWNFPVNYQDWKPAVDVKETDDLFTIKADLPGMTKKDISVDVSKGILSISGKRDSASDNESDKYHYRERSHGSFDRSFNLPDTVNEEKINAIFKDGILKVELPKHDNSILKERSIKVN